MSIRTGIILIAALAAFQAVRGAELVRPIIVLLFTGFMMPTDWVMSAGRL